ncbi:malonyl-CoA-acyl carrier protein transacylase, mitochondrial-like [Tenrec ecaudatus]|uniref:malonyl-CoA-acyl carrier protein transacylase, mitochondrial-like n=1 Tax=Tenrec ecaudatus TaxID=94439 RepID=UPI003F59954A
MRPAGPVPPPRARRLAGRGDTLGGAVQHRQMTPTWLARPRTHTGPLAEQAVEKKKQIGAAGWRWRAGRTRSAASFPGPPPGGARVADLLRDAAAGDAPREAAARQPPGQCSVLLFPGQGSQAVGMGQGLLRYPRVPELYAAARRVLGYDLLELSLRGPQEALDRTAHCQPAVFVASLAAVEKLNHLQPEVYRPSQTPHLELSPERVASSRRAARALGARSESPSQGLATPPSPGQ